MLFEKLIEERETQAAESWRIRSIAKAMSDLKVLWRYCVSAITSDALHLGNQMCARRV